ncbi:MAG TPA: hypothetical protein VFL80_09045 [Thermoanaerobaculia bacterium]|nr:hypothetical protein [Thermoanaerobaculia bacterium]
MSRSVVAFLLIACASCAGIPAESPAALKGHLVLDVDPNPLVARQVGEDLYEVAFDIIMREQGGVGVRIDDFTVDAIAFKGVTVQSQMFPASFITDRGYPANVAAGKYLRFSFVKRWSLPTRLLLSGASLRVTARTTDENGRRNVSNARIGVTVADADLSGSSLK